MGNFLKNSIFVLSAIAFAACSGDSHDTSIGYQINTPNSSGGSRLVSVTRMGAFDKEFAWSFTYDRRNMTQAVSTLQEGNEGLLNGATVRYNLSYGTRDVKVSTNGTPVTLTLSNALVASAVSGTTTYQYSYMNGYLSHWNVLYRNVGFGNTVTKGASADIDWGVDGNIRQIRYTPSSEAPDYYYTYTFTYTSDRNENGILPEGISEALGCKGFEYFYYAGLLGKGTQHLVKQIKVEHSKDVTCNTQYDFTYRNSNGNVAFCSYVSGMRPVVVTYTYK